MYACAILPRTDAFRINSRVMRWFYFLPLLLLSACDGGLWNNPYPAAERGKSILYSAFTERPKHLDPAQAYS